MLHQLANAKITTPFQEILVSIFVEMESILLSMILTTAMMGTQMMETAVARIVEFKQILDVLILQTILNPSVVLSKLLISNFSTLKELSTKMRVISTLKSLLWIHN